MSHNDTPTNELRDNDGNLKDFDEVVNGETPDVDTKTRVSGSGGDPARTFEQHMKDNGLNPDVSLT